MDHHACERNALHNIDSLKQDQKGTAELFQEIAKGMSTHARPPPAKVVNHVLLRCILAMHIAVTRK